MDSLELFRRFAVALALGLLVGMERGWSGQKEEGKHVGGLRTFGLLGLLGGVWALLSEELGAALLGFALLSLAMILATGYVLQARKSDDVGATTLVAALLTFALGAVAVHGQLVVAAAVAVVGSVLLGLKPVLHGLLARVERKELYAAFQLLLISVVLLPVLPNENMGPFDALNPYKIWWMVVLIGTISFVGYLAVKLTGPRLGVVVTSVFGGLVSSTAVTLSFSRMGRVNPGMARLLAAGITVASAIMVPRVLVEVSVFQASMVRGLVAPLGALGLVCVLPGLYFLLRPSETDGEGRLAIQNPLELGKALKFGLLIAAITLLARVLRTELGETGIYLLSAVSGLTDVDAITLSLAQMVDESQLDADVAQRGIVLAAIANTLSKAALAFFVGGTRIGWRVLTAFLLAAAAAGALAFLPSAQGLF